MLFAIFLNDMEDFFRQHNGSNYSKLKIEILDNDTRTGEFDTFLRLSVFMYADDY